MNPTNKPSPASGKGCQPKTEKQANQMAYYDEVASLWKFHRPLTQAMIEKLCHDYTGEIRGISLDVWREVLTKMTERNTIRGPLGYLRCLLDEKFGVIKS